MLARCRFLQNLSLISLTLLLFVEHLLSLRVAAADDWVDFRQTGRFLVRSEFPIGGDDELAEFLRHLDQHEADLVATLRLKPSDQPIVINLFTSRRGFLRAIRSVAPEATNRRAVFVRGDDAGRVYCYRHGELLTDLRHELTHAILHSMLPFLPLWLDEGLAEYFETPPTERASGHPSQQRVALAVKFGLTWRPNLTKLEAKNELSEVSLASYREAWAWVHFLLHGPPEVTQLLQRYLLTIQAEQPPGPFSAHLRQVVPDPERALTTHLKNWK
ncbi:hypothetical protein GC176_24100 [bacterium]|nr:hypothetical protein [bacterium]